MNRGIAVEITIQEAWQLFIEQDRKCWLTGELIGFYEKGKRSDRVASQTASLDRVDNSKFYTKENCRWIHKKVQRLKSNLSLDDLVEWAKKIAEYHSKR